MQKIASCPSYLRHVVRHQAKYLQSSRGLSTEVELFINDKSIKVDDSYTLFQACHEAGEVVPRFCYHEKLAVSGNCRMCLVEVEGMAKPIAACTQPVMKGMKVKLNSEKTRIARGGVLEFLLANHPLDCPICDQGGECDLQDIFMKYGFQEARHLDMRRAVQDKDIGPLIKTSMNRCIHCTRCVRVAQLIGDPVLGGTGRGVHKEMGTYIDNYVTSELSGNIVDLCPVGALTHKPSAFKFRAWELKSHYSIDVMDALGSNIEVNTRGAELMRILPRVNENVNEEWISDKARHSFDGLQTKRFTTPLKKNNEGKFEEISWPEAFSLIKSKLKETKANEIRGIIGSFADVESIVAFRDLMYSIGCNSLETRDDGMKVDIDFRSQYLMNSRITGVEDSDLLLLVGSNPRSEAPVFNARIKKAIKETGLKVAVIGEAVDLTYPYIHLGNSTKTLKEIAEGKHPFCAEISNAELPMIITGSSVFERKDANELTNLLYSICENSPILNKEKHWNGFNVLHQEAAKAGALDLGIPTSFNQDIKPKFVYLLGADKFKKQDLPEDSFIVYQGVMGDKGALMADLILPGTSYLEKNGTFVNTEGRVQVVRKALTPPGYSREDWAILRALSEELGVTLPYDTLNQVRDRIAELAPHLIKYDHLETYGFEELALKPNNSRHHPIFSPLTDNIDNYYASDIISKSSSVMSKCSKAFNPIRLTNFKSPTY